MDPHADDTYGNAIHTRDLMMAHGLKSAILVTRRTTSSAVLTFRGVYDGTGISVIGRPHRREWRKTSWWMKPRRVH